MERFENLVRIRRPAWELQQRHEQDSGYAGDELTGFLEDHSTVSCSNRAVRTEVKDRAYAIKCV